MMREKEPESHTLKLPLLTTPKTMNYNDLYTTYNYDSIATQLTASVPFKWEQAPGKPILSPTESTKMSSPVTLELPPRLQVAKVPSPEDEGHFGKFTVGEMVRRERRKKGMFGSWGGCGNKEVVGGSFVFPSDYGESGGFERVKRVRRNPSFSNLGEIKSYFWVNMYQGLKQVMPWRSKKLKKEGLRV